MKFYFEAEEKYPIVLSKSIIMDFFIIKLYLYIKYNLKMSKILTMRENRMFLKYHNKRIPNTINKIKKKVFKLMINGMCDNNCDINNNYNTIQNIIIKNTFVFYICRA